MKPLRNALLLSSIASAFLMHVSPVDAGADVVKVFLLGGQSNMVGRGKTTGLPSALQASQTDVRFFWGSGAGTANDPLVKSGLTTLRPGSGGNASEFGPEVTFGRTLADAIPDETFDLIKYAAEGTSLAQNWDPKAFNSFYKTFRNTVTAGVDELTAAGHTVEIVGMLWYQGGADAKAGRTTAQYEFDLNEFIADVRERYGENLPFFIGRLANNSPVLTAEELENIRTAQENAAAADPFAYLVDADGITYGANDHFDANGQIALGQRFAQSYLGTVPEPSAAAALVAGVVAFRRRPAAG